MRLTVGPLPPAVYWRRRATVLGALLVVLLVIFYACTGPGGSAGAANDSADATTPATGGQSTATPTVLTPEVGGPAGDAPTTGPPPAATATATVPAVPASPTAEDCTDAEIRVTPIAGQNPVQTGVTIMLRLRIRNTSTRTCSRDVGADAQELYIKRGAEKAWSSDTCGQAKGSKTQQFTPSFEVEFSVSWNGRASSGCANGEASGAVLEPGEYQLIGRLTTKLSDPVKLTITS